jgi:hypothetical protein
VSGPQEGTPNGVDRLAQIENAKKLIEDSWFAPLWAEDGYRSCLACGNRYGHDDDCVIGPAVPALGALVEIAKAPC